MSTRFTPPISVDRATPPSRRRDKHVEEGRAIPADVATGLMAKIEAGQGRGLPDPVMPDYH